MQFDQSETARVHHLAWRAASGLYCLRSGSGRMMARNYLTFGDIDGKLDVLGAECTRCAPGRYSARHSSVLSL
jgi:ribosomal protein S27AE